MVGWLLRALLGESEEFVRLLACIYFNCLLACKGGAVDTYSVL